MPDTELVRDPAIVIPYATNTAPDTRSRRCLAAAAILCAVVVAVEMVFSAWQYYYTHEKPARVLVLTVLWIQAIGCFVAGYLCWHAYRLNRQLTLIIGLALILLMTAAGLPISRIANGKSFFAPVPSGGPRGGLSNGM